VSIGWQDVWVGVIAFLAAAFLYRHFRPRRSEVVTVIPVGELRVRKPRPPSSKTEGK